MIHDLPTEIHLKGQISTKENTIIDIPAVWPIIIYKLTLKNQYDNIKIYIWLFF